MVTLVAAGASLSRQGLADLYRERAQHELAARPASALADANRSLDIDSDAVETYYVKAAALARFDQAAGAETALRQALAQEPDNFVTWALLGDVAVREHRLRVARRDYTSAHQLNPRHSHTGGTVTRSGLRAALSLDCRRRQIAVALSLVPAARGRSVWNAVTA